MPGRRPNARLRILEAAWHQAESGHIGSVDQIARAAGVSRQAVYLHFGSRAGLLLALVAHVDTQLGLDRNLAEIDAEDPADRLLATLALMVDYEPRIQGVAMSLYRNAATDAAIRAAYEDRMARRRETLRRFLEPLAAAGRLDRDWKLDEIVDLLWEATSPSSYEHMVNERGWHHERYKAWIQHLARGFLREDAGT